MQTFIRAVLLMLTFATNLTFAEVPTPVTDGSGRKLYFIFLTKGSVNDQSAGMELPARTPRDLQNLIDFRGWHKPQVRALVRALEAQYQIEAVAMTSYTIPSFSAHLSDESASRIALDPRVKEVVLQHENVVRFSQLWADQFDGSERIPWGKIAIGTNDASSTTNVVYMIDGGAVVPVGGTDFDHTDLTLIHAAEGNPRTGEYHANHVAGVLAAKMNGQGVRGINPGATVVDVNIGSTPAHFATAMDWVLIDAEDQGVYGVVNISSNYPQQFYPVEFATFQRYFRRMSNRLLVVQSAGNERQDACGHAYPTTATNDGILVVGGFDENERQAAPYDNRPWGSILQAGSNFGSCVEVWGPSQHVWSTWHTSVTANEVISGTSSAAPHVAGFAARIGNNATTPLLREYYVRGFLQNTGNFDDAGLPILKPYPSLGARTKYHLTGPSFFASATAVSSAAGSSPANAIDGKSLEAWNSGQAAPAWVEIDLGAVRQVTDIRLSPSQNPDGNATHLIYAGSSPAPTNLVASVSKFVSDFEPISLSLSPVVSARYVRILTQSSPSWVAWYEIEIYGYL